MVELSEKEEERAIGLHKKCIVVDMLNASMRPDEAYVNKMIAGGATALNMSIAVDENFTEAIKKVYEWYGYFEKFSDKMVLVRNTSDIKKVKEEGKVGILLAFQNTCHIENDLNLLSIFKQLGVSFMQVTYNHRNLAGDGCTERTNAGLSDFGVAMIKEMNRLGIGIDLSHVGRATIKDVLEFTEKPVFFTHVGSYSICEAPRNFRDNELKAIADTGGVIGVNTLANFVSRKPGPEVTIYDWLDHVDHIVKVVGADHVGFGTDFTENSKASDYPDYSDYAEDTLFTRWPWHYPKGLQTVSEFPNITRGLISRGYSDDDIEKILGGNFLRVFKEMAG